MKRHPSELARGIAARLEKEKRFAADRVARLFPIGSRVRIEAGNVRGYLRIEVTRHGSDWSEPLTVYGINTITGKPRRFYVGTDEVIDIEVPRKAARK